MDRRDLLLLFANFDSGPVAGCIHSWKRDDGKIITLVPLVGGRMRITRGEDIQTWNDGW